MSRIAIVGPGAIGATLAAGLQRTGRHEILLCARRNGPGATVEMIDGHTVTLPAASTDAAAAPAVDWIFIATKAYDAESAAAWLPRLGAHGAPVAILQNGVEHRERFARYLPAERIVPVIVDLPAERLEPGRIRQRGPGTLTVPDDPPGRAFAALFNGTPVAAAATPDFLSAAWRKLCINAVGVISALTLEPARIMREAGPADVARALLREAIAVGRAEGATLDDTLVETVVERYRAAPPDAVNSLHADRLAGRPMEIDARNGAIVRLGRKHGIPTPCNHMAVVLLAALARPGP